MAEDTENRGQGPASKEPTEHDGGSANTITHSLLRHVPGIVESCGAAALFVYVDAIDEEAPDLGLSVKAKVFCVTKAAPDGRESRVGALQCLRIPNVPMTRIGQVKIAVFLALARGLIKHGDRHHAAAAITAVTDAIAVTVSESTGSITIFRGGRIITEIQKPRSTGEESKWLRSRPYKSLKRD
ncbi:MAG: hypothetical protein FJ280_18975 [Planctomycetes bacterium]|nr:hypothetical protein [Planctomycetota bacterium]